MKITRTKRDGLDGTEVAFEYKDEDGAVPFSVIASRRGLLLTGRSPHMETVRDLDRFAKIIADAWAEHTKLKPKIMVRAGDGEQI